MRAMIKFVSAAALAFAAPASFAQYPYSDWPGPWHMWWGGGWGFWWVFPLLMMIAMIAICAFFMSRMFGGHGHSHGGDASGSALRLLSERFARGEISKEEFEEKRTILGGGR